MDKDYLTEKKYTPKEAAALLGGKKMSPKTLAGWRASGEHNLPFIKMGGLICYLESDLNAYLHASRFPHLAAYKKAKKENL